MAYKGKEGKGENAFKDTILSDSDGSSAEFDCETCGLVFNDPKSYENHLHGKKHSKKIAEVKLKAKSKATDKDTESENDDSEKEMFCKICDSSFTSYVSYAAHIKGRNHAKNVKKQKLKKQLDDMPEVIKKENGETDPEDDGILPKTYAICPTCEKEFQGPESFKSHIKSSKHLKKVKQAKTLENLKKDKELPDDEESYSKCDLCKKSFNGIVTYQIHMQSGLHKKNIERKKIAEEIKHFCANTDSEDYVCKECKKPFTDPLAFKNHLQNNSHEKQKAKDALSEFLKANPDIVYVTPDYNESSGDETDKEESDSVYYLICKLCHTSFSGPENALDHINSKKHVTAKKEKKMKKLLKEQENSSSQTFKGNDEQKSDHASSGGSHPTNGSKNGNENKLDEFELI